MKRKHGVALGGFLLVFVFLASLLTVSLSATLQDDLAAAEKKLEEAKKKAQQYAEQIKEAKKDEERQLETKMLMESQLVTINEQLEAAQEVLDGLKIDLENKNEEIVVLQQQYDKSYALFCERARVNYESGKLSLLETLLSSGSFAEMLTRVDLQTQLVAYDQNLMRSLNASIDEQQELSEELAAQLERQKTVTEEIEALSAEQEKQLKEVEKMLKKIQQDQQKYEQEEAKLEKKMDEYEDLIDELVDAIKRYNGGELLWPIKAGNSCRITSDFGMRTLNGVTSFHKAIDIGAAYGTPVVAAEAGTVIRSGFYDGGGGYQIYIDHGGELVTIYYHMSKLAVKSGVEVKKGDVIGYVGSTGNSTGNHLDFRIRYKGVYYDPECFVDINNAARERYSKFTSKFAGQKTAYSVEDIFQGNVSSKYKY